MIFFYGRGVSCVRSCVSADTAKFLFTQQGKHLPTVEKNFIHRYWSKKILADIGNESLQIEV